ncbi:hypothetical protein [Cylindrospermum stagnale]|nr:hypothetical protein [Cylindrospermum stagnale]
MVVFSNTYSEYRSEIEQKFKVENSKSPGARQNWGKSVGVNICRWDEALMNSWFENPSNFFTQLSLIYAFLLI